MNDPAGLPMARSSQSDFCAYCGCPVKAQFYFCTNCAAPYQPPDAVLPAIRPIQQTEGELITTNAPHVLPVFWTYFIVVIAAAVIGSAVFSKDRPDLRLFFESIAITLTTGFFVAFHWRALVPQFQRLGFNSKHAWIALALLFPALGLNFVWHKMITYLVPEATDSMKSLHELHLSRLTMVTLFCLFPAVTEEIAFRGLVQHWLVSAIAPMRGLLIASALFMALHFSVLSGPYLLLVGMLLGWAKLKTGSLYPSMLIHFLHNFIVITFFHL
jgi:membrane protease YdiL (CAAX protease family)